MPMHHLQPVPSTAATVVRRVLVQLQDLRRVAADDQQRTFQAIDTAELEFRATARKVQAAAQKEREGYQKIQIPCGGVIVEEEEEEEVVWDREEANLNDKEALSDATAQRCLEAPSENPGYLSECVLPLRWGLPCRHWMWPSAATNISLPFSLIHLRWHFEPPVELSGAWSMSWVPVELSEEEKTKRQEAALNRLRLDPLRNHGEDLLLRSVLILMEGHRELTARNRLPMAMSLAKAMKQTKTSWQTIHAKDASNPPRLPDPLPTQKGLRFEKQQQRKGAFTAREAADKSIEEERKKKAVENREKAREEARAEADKENRARRKHEAAMDDDWLDIDNINVSPASSLALGSQYLSLIQGPPSPQALLLPPVRRPTSQLLHWQQILRQRQSKQDSASPPRNSSVKASRRRCLSNQKQKASRRREQEKTEEARVKEPAAAKNAARKEKRVRTLRSGKSETVTQPPEFEVTEDYFAWSGTEENSSNRRLTKLASLRASYGAGSRATISSTPRQVYTVPKFFWQVAQSSDFVSS
ncbi:hypothetical protein MMC22_006447 [Lobaria immixta]|nr:hypothetical protein [Lobaria immixta]